MQKKRGNYAEFLGISAENEIFGVKVIRPLLAYSKQQLKQYGDENAVPYSIDQSNLTDIYTRNQIRHNVVEKLTIEERKQILEEIKNGNQSFTEFRSVFGFDEFDKLEYENFVKLTNHFMKLTKTHRDLSKSFVAEIKKAFRTNSTQRFEITDKLWLEKDYDEVYFVNAERVKPYKMQFECKFKNEFIEVDFSNGAEDRGIKNTSNAFVIKNLDKNDEYIIKDYSSQVRRLFIDWKMPLFLREIWPGIYDKNGKLIYVPRYRKEFKDNHKSKFVIDTKYFTEF